MAGALSVIVTRAYVRLYPRKYTPSFKIGTASEGKRLSTWWWELVKDTKIIVLQEQNQRFSIEDKMKGMDLFKSHVRCFILSYNMADLRRGK